MSSTTWTPRAVASEREALARRRVARRRGAARRVDDGARRHARRADAARASCVDDEQAAAPRGGCPPALPALHAVPLPAAAGRLALPRRRTTRACSTRPTRSAPRAPSSATGAGATWSTRRRSTAMPVQPQTVFRVRLAAAAVDLRRAPFAAAPRALDRTRRLRRPARRSRASRARRAVQAIRYAVGARPASTPDAARCSTLPRFAKPEPIEQQTWLLSVTRERVVWTRLNTLRSETFEFAADWPGRRAATRTRRRRSSDAIVVRALGRTDYEAMLARDAARSPMRARPDTPDELWLTEHRADLHARPRRPTRAPAARQRDPGAQGRPRRPGDVPRARPAGRVRARRPRACAGSASATMVRRLEEAVIEWLASSGISAYGKIAAPGVYVARDGVEAKIAALGLKVRNGLHLPRSRGQRRDGPCAVRGHRPVRLPGPRGHAARRPRRHAMTRASGPATTLAPILVRTLRPPTP